MRYAVIDRARAVAEGLGMAGRSTNLKEGVCIADEIELMGTPLYEGAEWKSLGEIRMLLSKGGFEHEH